MKLQCWGQVHLDPERVSSADGYLLKSYPGTSPHTKASNNPGPMLVVDSLFTSLPH